MKYVYQLLATSRYFGAVFFIFLSFLKPVHAQVTPNINSGNPKFPFPQFLDYGPDRKSLASHNAPGMTHAEMEKRTREAWQLVCNNTSPYPGAIVSGVQYLYPTAPEHCTCVEGDAYYLLGAAIMGDKEYFDGYYMWAHDRAFNGTKRFIDGVFNTPNYEYSKGLSGAGSFGAGTGVFGQGINGNSATDGDVDMALALLMAYKQWGEHSGIILSDNGWNNKEINYKEEALNYIRAMVDTVKYPVNDNFTSGVVGLDGYLKGGDSQGELTDWAKVTNYLNIPLEVGQQNYYYDYSAPAWFKSFRNFLESENDSPFYINQYKRVEASCDWLMGQHYSKNVKNIPYLGKVSWKGGNDFEFDNYIPDGEDFRASWRTIMNYVWHGNPTYTWNPDSHQAEDNNSNTFERDMGLRYAQFLKNNQGAPWNNPCRNKGDLKPGLTFNGPYTLVNGYTPDGRPFSGIDPEDGSPNGFPLNWIHGTGASSAIVAQDFELMGEMFRHCVIAWDAASGKNLDSRPIYFHEWFRLLGMLTLAGNFHSPENMIARPNLKVYHKVDKTFGFTGDQLTFTVSIRNYGSVDANGSVVKFGIPAGFEYVNSNKGTLSGDSVVWNIGTVKGFQSGGIAATIDSMKITLKVGPNASGRYCTNARIYCTNGLGWTSDEYPNNITTVMERNCVDIVKRALKIEKTASRKEVNPATNGDVVYKIKFENSSDAGWINGGRPGVRLAFAHEELTTPFSTNSNVLKFRLFHDAAEPYIDYGNYRVSYFMNDNNIKGYSTSGGTSTWGLQNTIAEGVDKDLVTVTHEQITPGSDANGSWNQRIVLQFSPQVATITQHLQQYAGESGTETIHEGGKAALRGVWRMFTNNNIPVDWTDDWSWDATQKDGDGGLYFPISDDYTDPNNLGIPINSWHRSACQTSSTIVKKVLVEEWDGYVWRRVLGNGPVPGRDISNVIVTDTLPQGVAFKNFIRQTALGIDASTTTLSDGRTVIKWSIPKMQVNQKDSLIFTATVSGTCPGADRLLVNNAWIEGNSESAISESDTITVTCNAVTICPDPTTITKTSDKPTYVIDDEVTYTLEYTQTQGSIADPDLSTSTDWTAQSGSMSNASFTGGKASIGQINGGDLVLTHDYSYGTNTLGDGIEGTIQITSYAKAAIVVRHGGGSYNNGVFVVIKPAYPSYVIVYNGTTKLDSSSFPVQEPPSIDFRIKLNGDKLDLWIGPTPTAFSGAPSMSFTGVTVQPGFVGFSRGTTIGDPSGTGTISSWRTHMDAAFDVVITDPVPNGITSPTAISNSGTNNAGVITWNLATGKTPMPYGTQQSLSWKGIFSICDKITNVAYVNTKGLPNNTYGVCYDINCGTTPTCTPPTSAVISGINSIQEGSTTELTATITPATSGWVYNWYKLPDMTTPLAVSGLNKNVITVSDSGRYVVRVVSPTDPSCSVLSSVFNVSYIESCEAIDTVLVTVSALLEPAKTVTLTAETTPVSTGLNYQWYKLPDIATPLAESGLDKTVVTVSDTGRYIVVASDPADPTCQTTSAETRVDYLCEKAIIKPFWNGAPIDLSNPISLCEGESGILSFAPQLYDFEYDIRQITGTPILDGEAVPAGDSAKVAISSANAGSWFLSIYADPGNSDQQLCWAYTDIKVLTINSITKPAPVITATPDGKYCEGDQGVTLTTNTGTNYTYVWKKDDVVQPTGTQPNVINNATAGLWKVAIGVNGVCSDSTEFEVAEVVKPVAEFTSNATSLTYCPGGGGINLLAKSATGMQYQFLKNSTPVGAFSSTTTQLADEGDWLVVFENESGCKDTSDIIVVSQSSELSVEVEGDTAICSGQTLTLSTNLGAQSVTWTLPDNSTQDAIELSLTTPVSGLYKVYYEDGSGCSGKDSVNVIVESASPDPLVSILEQTPEACEGESLTFTAQIQDAVNPQIEWFVNKTRQSSTIETIILTSLKNEDTVKVFVTSESTCNGIQQVGDSVQVTIHSLPVVGISSVSDLFCVGESLELVSENTDLDLFEWYKDGSVYSSDPGNLTVSEGGTYSLKGTDINGCSATSTELEIELITMPDVTISSTETAICSGSQIDISSNVTDNSFTYSWFDQDNNDLGISGPVATITQPGSYRLIVLSGSCDAISNTLEIGNLVLETPLISGSNFPVCEAEGEIYSITNPLSNAQYHWDLPSGSQIASQNTGNVLVNFGDQDGVISVYATNSQGCESPVGELPISLQLCDFKAKIAYDKSSICPGDEVLFQSVSTGTTAGTTYSWNFGPGATPATYDQPGPILVKFTQSGAAQVSLTISENGVSNTMTLTSNEVMVNERPVISNISGSSLICLNSPAEFTASVSVNAEVQWILSDNLIQNSKPTLYSVTVTGIQSGTGLLQAYVQSSAGCYSDTLEEIVTIEDKPTIALEADGLVLCTDGKVNLTATGNGSSVQWYMNNQPMTNKSGNEIEVDEAGEYFVTTGTGNCVAISDTVQISNSGLVADAGFDQLIEIGQSTHLLATSNSTSVSYRWEPGMLSLPSPLVSPNETTLYTVYIEDENGCQANDDVLITVVQPLFIPNAFTPNGDGVHDVWEIEGLERFTNLKVEIFNRWGQVIYNSNGTYKPWDGTRNGVEMPVATYYYVIDGGDNSEPITGAVLLSK